MRNFAGAGIAGIVLGLLMALSLLGLISVAHSAQGPSIGGTIVPPALVCQEDEVIGFIGIDTLGCIHIEGNVVEGGTYEAEL